MRTLDLPQGAVHRSKRLRTLFESANLNHRYRPLRGLLFSLSIHGLLLFGTLLFQIHDRVSEQSQYLARAVMTGHNRMVLYLPPLGGKPQPKGEPKPGSRLDDKSTPVASAPKTRGLSYPGPQSIESDFEKPTNRIQTVLQPDLPHPAILKPPLLLPNIVQVADAGPAPALKVPDPILKPAEPAMLAVRPVLLLPLDPAEKIEVPAIPVESARVPEANSPQSPQKAPEPPKPVEQLKEERPVLHSPVPVSGPDRKNLLALTPMPTVPEAPVSVPPGEARGRFAISPDPNLAASETEPGSKSTTTSAAGSGLAAGSGTSSAPGKNVFPGITILGATVDTRTGGNPAPNPRTPAPLQTSYGITVLSSAAAGGGLPNLGVFSNEQVYTAFLDTRRNLSDLSPSWTVEYALLQRTPGQASGAGKPDGSQLGIVLPFPTVKEQPAMPEELVTRYPRRMVIVYGIINIEGKLEQMVVKDSPDARLNEPVINALGKWVFRPAQRDGESVPAKALFGIPVWAPLVP